MSYDEPDEVTAKTRQQEALAAVGAAQGQCEHCGTYTSTGAPPVLHQADCALPGLGRAGAFAYRLPD